MSLGWLGLVGLGEVIGGSVDVCPDVGGVVGGSMEPGPEQSPDHASLPLLPVPLSFRPLNKHSSRALGRWMRIMSCGWGAGGRAGGARGGDGGVGLLKGLCYRCAAGERCMAPSQSRAGGGQ